MFFHAVLEESEIMKAICFSFGLFFDSVKCELAFRVDVK